MPAENTRVKAVAQVGRQGAGIHKLEIAVIRFEVEEKQEGLLLRHIKTIDKHQRIHVNIKYSVQLFVFAYL